ncbi:Crp/Fnr family transcriptional regulator [Bradyrhizobium zhanjiangense]|uniref:Crp/Fnr family transcriptional regulator n=1 Tax=Bradyrhizobium zhanjiangense TaxID=1325107 RepID=A0A4Q0R001_9BRAD|nr:Crp/Fnr family transcriptional regulator [Bradyrhizobium zhanjiangense]RXG98990.1 Crp/Fnr family transcriptional regulator [Bradyrhizobium zhanjiangense]RXH03211.1 Crp/Fnr family transcriptional regulator [Bradyrhizobium zhanjiangense]
MFKSTLGGGDREQTVRVQNRLLGGLAPASFEQLRPFLQPVALKRRAILQDYHHPIEHIYFIERGVASLLVRTQRDGPVGIAMVGRLGFVGVAAALGMQRSPNRCLMSVPGYALRIAVPDLSRAAHRSPDIQQQLFSYIHALLVQNAQTTLCSARHSLEERLSRWLLLAADRLDDRIIPVTHDMLSVILGVRRASITTTLAELEQSGGLIRQRGGIDVCDHAALELRTCECYQIIASEYRYLNRSGLHEHRISADADLMRACLCCV